MRVRGLKGLAALLVVGVCLTTGSAFADNITIWDGTAPNGSGVGYEDGEVEPGCVNTQDWDLEAFLLDGSTLTLVGGWDFQNGMQDPYRGTGRPDFNTPANPNWYLSGDIFFDTDSDAVYGNASNVQYPQQSIVGDTWGYDYVMDIDWLTGSWQVFDITNGKTTLVTTAYFPTNNEANPWAYNDGGTAVGNMVADGVAYGSYSDTGGMHRTASVDLSWLSANDFTVHFTQECGNDNLMGHATGGGWYTPPVPEPSTILLMGLAVGGLVVRRLKTQLI